MKKAVIYIFWLLSIAEFYSCQQKMICPAYHSYFILDVDETKKKFSYYGQDSLAKKIWEVDKKKVGIADEKPYQKKLNEMNTVSMNSIYKKLDEQDLFKREIVTYAESDTVPAFLDTAALLAQEDTDFENIDQMIYLHHFGKYLPKRGGQYDEFSEDLKEGDESTTDETEVQEEPKKKGFWPFGKKKNKKSDSNESLDEGDGGGDEYLDGKEDQDIDEEMDQKPQKEKKPKKEKKKKEKKAKKKKDWEDDQESEDESGE